jgi:hypothetical protein
MTAFNIAGCPLSLLTKPGDKTAPRTNVQKKQSAIKEHSTSEFLLDVA